MNNSSAVSHCMDIHIHWQKNVPHGSIELSGFEAKQNPDVLPILITVVKEGE